MRTEIEDTDFRDVQPVAEDLQAIRSNESLCLL